MDCQGSGATNRSIAGGRKIKRDQTSHCSSSGITIYHIMGYLAVKLLKKSWQDYKYEREPVKSELEQLQIKLIAGMLWHQVNKPQGCKRTFLASGWNKVKYSLTVSIRWLLTRHMHTVVWFERRRHLVLAWLTCFGRYNIYLGHDDFLNSWQTGRKNFPLPMPNFWESHFIGSSQITDPVKIFNVVPFLQTVLVCGFELLLLRSTFRLWS